MKIEIRKLLNSNKFVYSTRLVVFCAAVAFIVVGVLKGGMGDVLMKAINICTECIGLG